MPEPAPSHGRMPALFLSHGAPTLADDADWCGDLAGWAAALPRPTAILIVSAHWEAAPLTVGATRTVPLTYDFWGFPQRYYQVSYPAPGAPELAAQVRDVLRGTGIGNQPQDSPDRGLDHGAYVPLMAMYPQADIPVLQISMPTLDPVELLRIGQLLAPLRERGVLLVGSGFTTHNLRVMDLTQPADHPPPNWTVEFDDWVAHTVGARDVDALLDFEHTAPAVRRAHPRTEHFAPLFVALGAAVDTLRTERSVIDGYWYGLSKRSWQFDG